MLYDWSWEREILVAIVPRLSSISNLDFPRLSSAKWLLILGGSIGRLHKTPCKFPFVFPLSSHESGLRKDYLLPLMRSSQGFHLFSDIFLCNPARLKLADWCFQSPPLLEICLLD